MSTEGPTSRPDPPIRQVRVAQGISLRRLAYLAQVDPAHLSRVERGRASLSVDSLYRIASILGLKDLVRLLRPYVRSLAA